MNKAFKASGASLACLCSSDDVYAARAAHAAKALTTAGATHIYLAGRPKDADALKAAGVGSFIFAGCDALANAAGGAPAAFALTGGRDDRHDMLLTGGCQCGRVRYATSVLPDDVSVCHCRMCQKAVGGPFIALALVHPDQITWTRGKPASFRSSTIATRLSAPIAARRLLMSTTTAVTSN